ncbi:MAG TPA: hypothetical protein VGP47_05915 [Parachlamydiaceae bacterium]|nr:hypothetical protein [Parachlamydiaceae bacterium]
MIHYCRALIFVLTAAAILMVEQQCHGVSSVTPGNDEPWFTGPLLTPSARAIPPGHVNLEPYLFYNVITGRYGENWHATTLPTFNQITVQMQVKIGIIDRLDFSIAPQSSIAFSQGKTASSFGDLPIGFGYLLYRGEPDDWVDYLKLMVFEIIPIGKYHQLDPDLLGTDAFGQGSYITNIGLTVSKLFKVGCNHFLGCRCNITTSIAAPAKLRGFNIFGGNENTRGKIYPGTSWFFVAGAEFSVTQKFSLACDFLAQFSPKKHFKGFTEIPISPGETIQYSFAPAIEYNWNSSMGVIVGAWITVAGKNSSRFINGVAAFNYYF